MVALPRPNTVTGRPAGSYLTAREREIANLIGLGLTNKEIAARLKIAQRTADAHVQNMLNKLGASNRAQIVAIASEHASSIDAVGVAPQPHLSPVAARRHPRYARAATFAAAAVITTLLFSADEQVGLVNKAATTQAAGASSVEIVDPFTGPDIDSSIWDLGEFKQVYIQHSGGHLGVYVAASAPQLFSAGVKTVCEARGDFDTQVSFELVRWPKDDGVWVSLLASGTPFNTYRVSMSRVESYGTFLPPAGRTVRATGVTGSLRLARVGSKWSGYYLANGRWSWIASGDGPIDDVGLSVVVFNGDAWPFGGREALVYFTNFRLNANRIVCP